MASAIARASMGIWGRSPQWGPGATPLVRGQGGEAPLKLTTFSQIKDNLNNENFTLFSIIYANYAVNNVTICAGTLAATLLVYKLDELVNGFANIYAVFNIDAMTL